ncbi:MAG: putative Glyoxalase [Nitrospira sp.]|nr:putative Glyoxalase [Nitrospira sp.]
MSSGLRNASWKRAESDPDGNEVELYADADEAIWKNDPDAVVSPIKPLRL